MGAFSRLSTTGSQPTDAEHQNGVPDAEPILPASTPAVGDAGSVGARIQEVLDSATAAAQKIRADAEAERARYLAGWRQEADRELADLRRELAELRDSLTARAHGVERQTGELVDAISGAIERLSARGRDGGPPVRNSPAPAAEPEVNAVVYPGRAPDEAWAERARIRAAEMLRAGTHRGEIERVLRLSFGIDDPGRVIDAALRTRAVGR